MHNVTAKLVRNHKTQCPFTIARNLNITIQFEDLGQGTRGFYYRVLKRRYICIHKDLPEEWQRFVCAHELGHDRLHKGVNQFFVDEHSFFLPGKFERQANEFAVSLLLHDKKFEAGETLINYFSRNKIPVQMIDFYKR
ncbi:Metallopeptidase ImmA [compost metagenome]